MMKTDTEIRSEGIRALMQVMGVFEAERFITLINRERFDYTEWRKNQWQEETVKSLATRARTLREIDSLRDIGHKEIENARDRI